MQTDHIFQLPLSFLSASTSADKKIPLYFEGDAEALRCSHHCGVGVLKKTINITATGSAGKEICKTSSCWVVKGMEKADRV